MDADCVIEKSLNTHQDIVRTYSECLYRGPNMSPTVVASYLTNVHDKINSSNCCIWDYRTMYEYEGFIFQLNILLTDATLIYLQEDFEDLKIKLELWIHELLPELVRLC